MKVGLLMIVARVLSVVAGAQLSLLLVSLPFNVLPNVMLSPSPVIQPNATTPQELATVTAIRWGLFILFAILGSGAWAMSRPPGLKPYYNSATRFPTLRMMFTGFAWGMFALTVGELRDWDQDTTTAAVFIVSLSWEFMMITVVWLGRRLSSNPMQFWQDMQAGRLMRQSRDVIIRDEDDGDDPNTPPASPKAKDPISKQGRWN